VQFLEAIFYICICDVGDHRRVTQGRLRSREATRELQRNGEALVHVVQGSNLKLRQIKTLSEHVHADDHTGCSRCKRSQSRATLAVRKFVVNDERGMFRSNPLIYSMNNLCPFD